MYLNQTKNMDQEDQTWVDLVMRRFEDEFRLLYKERQTAEGRTLIPIALVRQCNAVVS